MPTPNCHFTIRGPSPTTIEYKVSTASPSLTLRSQCLQYLTLLLRCLLGALILLAIALRFLDVQEPLRAGIEWGYHHVRDVSMSWFVGFVLVGGFLVTSRYHTGKLCFRVNEVSMEA